MVGVPVARPLPDIARHVVQAEVVGGERADRRGAVEAGLAGAAPREVGAVPVVGHDPAAGSLVVTPRERRPVEVAPGGSLPLRLGRQRPSGPVGVGHGVLVGEVDDGVIPAPLEVAAGAVRPAPVGARLPSPPLAQVAQIDRASRRGEDHRSRLQVLDRRAREVGRIERSLGHRRVTRGVDEGAELFVRHLVSLHPEPVDGDTMARCFLGLVTVRPHRERATRYPHDVSRRRSVDVIHEPPRRTLARAVDGTCRRGWETGVVDDGSAPDAWRS